jgi:hypothetical protein
MKAKSKLNPNQNLAILTHFFMVYDLWFIVHGSWFIARRQRAEGKGRSF